LLPSFWPDPLKPFGLVLKSFFSFDVISSIVMSAPILCGQKSYFEWRYKLARLLTREAGANKRRCSDLAGSASKQENGTERLGPIPLEIICHQTSVTLSKRVSIAKGTMRKEQLTNSIVDLIIMQCLP